MKKILLIALIAIIFVFSSLETKSCPPWADNSQEFTFTVGECEYKATLCWKCPVSSYILRIELTNVYALPPCSSEKVPEEIIDEIYEQITGNMKWWFLNLCWNFLTPCPEVKIFHLTKPNCWYEYLDNEGIYRYFSCNDDNSYCQKDYSVCWDSNLGPIIKKLTDWYHVGNPPNCQIDEPDPPKNKGETTPCWLLFNCP